MSKTYGKERDLEIGQTLKFIKEHKDIKSTLDVGAHHTFASYAKEVKDMVTVANGVDVAPDPKTAKILDNYFVGNVTDPKLKIPKADLVFSISSIEHSGISTYQADWEKERVNVFKRMHELANKYLVITCPFGAPMIIEGQYANVTHQHLHAFGQAIGQMLDNVAEFYYRPDQTSDFAPIPYNEACNVEFDPNVGVPRCIMVLKLKKRS